MSRFPMTLILLGSLTPVAAPALAQQAFDGNWTIEARPETGTCRKVHRYAVVIEDGLLRARGRERFTVSGGLDTGGALRGTVQRGKTRVQVTGRLSGRSGSGAWTIAGRIACQGRWHAEKGGQGP